MLRECLETELDVVEGGRLWWAALRTFLWGPLQTRAVLDYRIASWLYAIGYRRICRYKTNA